MSESPEPESPTSPVTLDKPETPETTEPSQPPAPARRRRVLPKLLVTVGAVALVVVLKLAVGGGLGFGLKWLENDPDLAEVGDCMKTAGANNLEVIGCSETDARFKVVGKVENQSEAQFRASSGGEVCKPYPTAKSAFWKGPRNGNGYVLCLAPN